MVSNNNLTRFTTIDLKQQQTQPLINEMEHLANRLADQVFQATFLKTAAQQDESRVVIL